MKINVLNISGLVLANLFLAALLIMSCQKEPAATNLPVDLSGPVFKSADGAQVFVQTEEILAETSAADRGPEGGGGDVQPVYPFSGGKCQLIFKFFSYNPGLPHGGGDPPCNGYGIEVEGRTQPNGQGALLFSDYRSIDGLWQKISIPGSAYIRFRILHEFAGAENGPCKFKMIMGDYGWNKAAYYWLGLIPDVWYPIVTGRFAPKDPSTDGFPTMYIEEYLCDSWCTWTAAVNFDPNDPNDPNPLPWISAALRCYNGSNIPPFYNPGDPRLIKDYPIWEAVPQSFYIYPVNQGPGVYRTEAVDIGPANPEWWLYYKIHGPSGIGPTFGGYGPAPFPIGSASDCNVYLVE